MEARRRHRRPGYRSVACGVVPAARDGLPDPRRRARLAPPPSAGRRYVLWIPLGALVALSLITALLGAGSGRAVPVLWLGAATVGSVTVGILLALRARRAGRDLVALLFLVGIGVTFLLNGLARLPDQSETVQWAAQIANTLNQLVFTLAAWRLWMAESHRSFEPVARDAVEDAPATRAH